MRADAATRELLLIDDDPVFTRVLARALSARGFSVAVAHDRVQALDLCRKILPVYAVLDLKLGDDNGLKLIPELGAVSPGLRIVLLTGYASIATAVAAIKRGAHQYLAKPVDADAVVRALLDAPGDVAQDAQSPSNAPPPLKRLEWEYIQQVFAECDGNVSETARRLGLHRRTLQRKLAKRPVRG
ncbi:MAG: response regulator transcription factor [Rudaea sp.]